MRSSSDFNYQNIQKVNSADSAHAFTGMRFQDHSSNLQLLSGNARLWLAVLSCGLNLLSLIDGRLSQGCTMRLAAGCKNLQTGAILELWYYGYSGRVQHVFLI